MPHKQDALAARAKHRVPVDELNEPLAPKMEVMHGLALRMALAPQVVVIVFRCQLDEAGVVGIHAGEQALQFGQGSSVEPSGVVPLAQRVLDEDLGRVRSLSVALLLGSGHGICRLHTAEEGRRKDVIQRPDPGQMLTQLAGLLQAFLRQRGIARVIA